MQTDNPGPWFLHCHIDFHLEAGFAVVMAEDIPDVKSANPVPREYNVLVFISTYTDRELLQRRGRTSAPSTTPSTPTTNEHFS